MAWRKVKEIEEIEEEEEGEIEVEDLWPDTAYEGCQHGNDSRVIHPEGHYVVCLGCGQAKPIIFIGVGN